MYKFHTFSDNTEFMICGHSILYITKKMLRNETTRNKEYLLNHGLCQVRDVCFKSLSYHIINVLSWTKMSENNPGLRIIHEHRYSAVDFP